MLRRETNGDGSKHWRFDLPTAITIFVVIVSGLVGYFVNLATMEVNIATNKTKIDVIEKKVEKVEYDIASLKDSQTAQTAIILEKIDDVKDAVEDLNP